MGSEQRICIINSCAPYSDRKYFWENISCYVIPGLSSLIIARDLNFSLGQGEISGTKLWWMNYLYFSLCYWHHTNFLILFLHLWVLLGTTGVKGWREYLRGWIDSFWIILCTTIRWVWDLKSCPPFFSIINLLFCNGKVWIRSKFTLSSSTQSGFRWRLSSIWSPKRSSQKHLWIIGWFFCATQYISWYPNWLHVELNLFYWGSSRRNNLDFWKADKFKMLLVLLRNWCILSSLRPMTVSTRIFWKWFWLKQACHKLSSSGSWLAFVPQILRSLSMACLRDFLVHIEDLDRDVPSLDSY